MSDLQDLFCELLPAPTDRTLPAAWTATDAVTSIHQVEKNQVAVSSLQLLKPEFGRPTLHRFSGLLLISFSDQPTAHLP